MNVLITGAASGIGYKLAMELIKRGHYVYLCVHHNNQVKTTFDKIKSINYQDRVSVIKLDITSEDDVNKIINLDIDCLVNQAGMGVGGSLIDLSINDIKDNFEVNFFGTLNMTKKYIESRKNRKGKVLITSSLAGIIPISFLGSYCSTKSALISMCTCLRKELKKTNKNINIKLIEPGAYKTGFNEVMILSNENNCENFNVHEIINKQLKKFNFIEKKIDTIVNKMIKAIETSNSKLVYKTPLLQSIGAKIYMLLFM